MRITVTGCSHRTAQLAIRERIAFDEHQVGEALAALRQRFGSAEAMLLSTCNRVELYIARPVHARPRRADVARFIAEFHGLPVEQVTEALYYHQDAKAVQHLMRVAGSVDSMVLGETQILGQVRDAFLAARSAGALGPTLTRLATDALATGKRVHTETALSEGRVSVASVAVQFARQIFSGFADKTVLIVGAGKMGEVTVDRLMELGPHRLVVVNRSRERAEALAARYRGAVRPFDQLADALADADIVITSTGATEPLIGPELMGPVMKKRRYRPLFMIDIAVPRDVDERVARIEQIYLYNIDNLQQVVEANLGERTRQAELAERICAEAADAFLAWMRTRTVGPTIAALRRRLESLRDEELAWLLPKLAEASGRDRELIEQFSRRLINKLAHGPMQHLAQAGQQHPSSAGGGSESLPSLDFYAQALVHLFELDVEPPQTEERQEE